MPAAVRLHCWPCGSRVPPRRRSRPKRSCCWHGWVDQYSAELFGEYRPLYKEGLPRLSRSVVFARGQQSHAANETCPGNFVE